jgi:hypothetical protein
MGRLGTHFEQVPKVVIDRILAQQNLEATVRSEDLDSPEELTAQKIKRPILPQEK